METKILHKIAGADGMEAHVAQIDRGFSVVLLDAESGFYLPTCKILKTEAEALVYTTTILERPMVLSVRHFTFGWKFINEALGIQSKSFRTRSEAVKAAKSKYPDAQIIG